MAALEVLATGASRADGGDRTLARGDRLAVRDLRRRRHDDARAGDLGAPAEVEVFPERRDQRVEAAQRREEVAAHEGDAAGRDEDVAFEVLLAVVDLARLDPFVHDPESVTRLAHVEQHHRVVVGDDLRGDDAGVGAKGRLDHHLHRVGLETDVVVTEEEEGRALDHQRGLVTGRGEATVLVEQSHEGVRGDRGDARGDVFGLPVRDDEQA